MPVDIRFTVIIPHYNIPELLERCLKSIPKRDDVQVIIVDDHSDAECVSIIKNELQPKFSNFQFVYQDKNGGGGKCRNIGLGLAKGEWLLFADADDFFSDDLSLILDKYSTGEYDENDIVFFRVGCVLSENTAIASSKRNLNKFRVDEFLATNEERVLRFLHSEPWGKMIKSNLVRKYGIKFSETKVCNDYYFSALTGFHANKIKGDELYLYYVTVRNGSVSSKTDSVDKIKTRIQVAVSVDAYLLKQGYKIEEKFKPEKLDCRMIALMKSDWKSGLKMFYKIKQMGLPILPIIGRMINIFINNRVYEKKDY